MYRDFLEYLMLSNLTWKPTWFKSHFSNIDNRTSAFTYLQIRVLGPQSKRPSDLKLDVNSQISPWNTICGCRVNFRGWRCRVEADYERRDNRRTEHDILSLNNVPTLKYINKERLRCPHTRNWSYLLFMLVTTPVQLSFSTTWLASPTGHSSYCKAPTVHTEMSPRHQDAKHESCPLQCTTQGERLATYGMTTCALQSKHKDGATLQHQPGTTPTSDASLYQIRLNKSPERAPELSTLLWNGSRHKNAG